MRLAVCTLSAVLLSGCSWLGYGGGGASYGGGSSYGYGANCANVGAYGGQYAYGNQYSHAGNAGGAYGGAYGAGCGVGGGFVAGGAGYGQGMAMGAYGAGGNGYGVGTGALGLRGAQGVGAYGAGMGGAGIGGAGMGGYGMNGATAYGTGMGAGGAYGTAGGGQFVNGQWVAGTTGAGTMLGGAAPYGAAAGGQWVNGQWVAGGTQVAGGYGYGTSGSVTTVQGAPIYVPQPYPAYYGVGYAAGGGLRGGYAALPFGVEASIGTDIAIGGDIFGAKTAGLATGSLTRSVSASDAIAYGDAYKNGVSYGLAATYDVDPSTTILGQVGYSKAEGERVQVGNVTDTGFPGVDEPYYATWSDLEQVTLEGGVRKYMGGWNNAMGGMRPYAQATAGFTHNSQVDVTQDSATIINPPEKQSYIDAGWTPTASAALGAEMQVGPRTAIGVEAGIRWRDDLNTNTASDDRWSVPIKLRGRVSF